MKANNDEPNMEDAKHGGCRTNAAMSCTRLCYQLNPPTPFHYTRGPDELSFQAMWRPSSVFVLDFNEGNVHHNFDDQRQRNFIKDWDWYLDQFRENDKQLLFKFKLHMRYFDGDATIVCKWLNFAIERGINELDISLPKENWEDKVEMQTKHEVFLPHTR